MEIKLIIKLNDIESSSNIIRKSKHLRIILKSELIRERIRIFIGGIIEYIR